MIRYLNFCLVLPLIIAIYALALDIGYRNAKQIKVIVETEYFESMLNYVIVHTIIRIFLKLYLYTILFTNITSWTALVSNSLFGWSLLRLYHILLESVLDVPRKLPLKFHQNRVSNSRDIPDMD